jgi:hypothetical protein
MRVLEADLDLCVCDLCIEFYLLSYPILMSKPSTHRMHQDQLFRTYGQKCSQITKCHNIGYNYYINNVFND